MAEEFKFPKYFEKCPICGCPDTTCRLAYKQEVVEKKRGPDAFASSEKRPTPLIDPRKATLVTPVLVEHFDTCAKCGLRYCTKAEITQGKIGTIPGMKGQGFQQGDPRFS